MAHPPVSSDDEDDVLSLMLKNGPPFTLCRQLRSEEGTAAKKEQAEPVDSEDIMVIAVDDRYEQEGGSETALKKVLKKKNKEKKKKVLKEPPAPCGSIAEDDAEADGAEAKTQSVEQLQEAICMQQETIKALEFQRKEAEAEDEMRWKWVGPSVQTVQPKPRPRQSNPRQPDPVHARLWSGCGVAAGLEVALYPKN